MRRTIHFVCNPDDVTQLIHVYRSLLLSLKLKVSVFRRNTKQRKPLTGTGHNLGSSSAGEWTSTSQSLLWTTSSQCIVMKGPEAQGSLSRLTQRECSLKRLHHHPRCAPPCRLTNDAGSLLLPCNGPTTVPTGSRRE